MQTSYSFYCVHEITLFISFYDKHSLNIESPIESCLRSLGEVLVQNVTLPSRLDLTVIDRWVVFLKISSALLCDMCSKFWLFTSKIYKDKEIAKLSGNIERKFKRVFILIRRTNGA